eukprot:78552_1
MLDERRIAGRLKWAGVSIATIGMLSHVSQETDQDYNIIVALLILFTSYTCNAQVNVLSGSLTCVSLLTDVIMLASYGGSDWKESSGARFGYACFIFNFFLKIAALIMMYTLYSELGGQYALKFSGDSGFQERSEYNPVDISTITAVNIGGANEVLSQETSDNYRRFEDLPSGAAQEDTRK